MSERTISWRELWGETAELVGDANHARWLCEAVSGCSGVEWYDVLDDPATERAVARLDAMVARRRSGEPLQYVLGSWAFRHLEVMVDRRVLIPRPETEEVADVAIGVARAVPAPRVVADLGTGSGVIALSLASELPIDGTTVWATDISPDALDVARANLAGIGRAARNVSLALGSWFEALPPSLRGGFDVIVSNPPYVAESSAELAEDVREWEPAIALFGGTAGLDSYRAIIDEAPAWLKARGALVLEIGYDQGEAIVEMLTTRGFVEATVRRDAAGLDRIAVGYLAG